MTEDNDTDSTRRDLMRILGAGGLTTGLAGCRSLLGTSIDAETEILDSDGQRLIRVQLSVRPPDNIERVIIEVNGTKATTIEQISNPMTADIPVEGGSRYNIEIVPHLGNWGGTNTNRKMIDVGYVPGADVPLDGDRTLCLHYYPWYGKADEPETWTDLAVSQPVLGEYESRNEQTIRRHLDWCTQAGVSWLSTSWWGPASFSDATILNHVLEVDRATEFTWSVIYETVGRFENVPVDLEASTPRERLAADLAYLDENYFGESWYHTIDERPVVFVFSAFELVGDADGAWQEAIEPLSSDPYLIADIDNKSVPDVVPVMEAADAYTTYNPYQVRPDIADVFREQTESMYRQWFLSREFVDADFIPTAIPGYNDSLLRDNPVLEPSRELYEWCARTARRYATGPEVVFITSFNEWYEDTQIEPDDETAEHLIDLTDDVFTDDGYTYPKFDGSELTIEFGDIVAEENLGVADSNRDLTFQCEKVIVESPSEEVLAEFDIGSPDEFVVLGGAYRPEETADGDNIRWFGSNSQTHLYLRGVTDVTTDHTIRLVGGAITEMDAVARTGDTEIGTARLKQSNATYRFT